MLKPNQPVQTQFSFQHVTQGVTAHALNKNWQKKLANCCDSPNSPKFFPLQSFLLYGICY